MSFEGIDADGRAIVGEGGFDAAIAAGCSPASVVTVTYTTRGVPVVSAEHRLPTGVTLDGYGRAVPPVRACNCGEGPLFACANRGSGPFCG